MLAGSYSPFRKWCMTGVLVWRRQTTRLCISHPNWEMWSLLLPWMGGALGKAIFRTTSLPYTRTQWLKVQCDVCHVTIMWRNRVSHFAELYAKKLGIRAELLRKTLWGDFYVNTKAKRIFQGAQVSNHGECRALSRLVMYFHHRPKLKSHFLCSSYLTIYGPCTMLW